MLSADAGMVEVEPGLWAYADQGEQGEYTGGSAYMVLPTTPVGTEQGGFPLWGALGAVGSVCGFGGL